MTLELNDLMALKSLDGGMSPYEQVKVANMQSKNRVSGVGIAGLVTGSVGIITGIAALLWAGAKSNGIRAYAEAKHDGLRDLVMLNAQTLATERAERIAGDITLTNTVNDSVSGSQQGTLTAQQAAELSSIQSVQQTLFNQAVMGNLSENPQKVMLYSAPQPCGCPGCGCNN